MRTLVLLVLLNLVFAQHLRAQTEEIQQLLLNVEKLAQHKQILEDMKKGYQLVSAGYATIQDVTQGNFRLHQVFLDGLLQVSPAVRQHWKVGEIMRCQLQLVRESGRAWRLFRKEGNFSPEELAYLDRVYERLLGQSLAQLDMLARVLSARQLRMSDEERLQAIDAIWLEMQDMLLALRHFNNSTGLLGLQRARERQAIGRLRSIYGITP